MEAKAAYAMPSRVKTGVRGGAEYGNAGYLCIDRRVSYHSPTPSPPPPCRPPPSPRHLSRPRATATPSPPAALHGADSVFVARGRDKEYLTLRQASDGSCLPRRQAVEVEAEAAGEAEGEGGGEAEGEVEGGGEVEGEVEGGGWDADAFEAAAMRAHSELRAVGERVLEGLERCDLASTSPIPPTSSIALDLR